MVDNRPTFDGDTGTETVESILARKDISDQEVIENAKHLENLLQAPGFKLLNQFVTQSVTYWSLQLLNCRDQIEMIRYQEIVKSYQGLLAWIETNIDAGRQLHDEVVSK